MEQAVHGWRELLVDHANCEKKAASSALALMFAYPEERTLTLALSRLAREELRHFEQVRALMQALQVPWVRQQPGRYATGLRAVLRSAEPQRRLDLLLCGALIEARSAERFVLLTAHGGLPASVARLYGTLAVSEARHHELYVDLAQAADAGWQSRLGELALLEARLATAPDTLLRFHSGPCPVSA